MVIREEFADVPSAGIAIYGSWAARYHDATGAPPKDVVVLVVGEPTRAELYDAAERAEQRIGFPVSVTLASPGRWAAASDALIRQLTPTARPGSTVPRISAIRAIAARAYGSELPTSLLWTLPRGGAILELPRHVIGNVARDRDRHPHLAGADVGGGAAPASI